MNTAKKLGKISNNNKPNVIGILGGTFDPIHFGHTLPTMQTAKWLGLEKIVLLPAHIPPHKTAPSTTAAQRVDMVKIICEDEPLFCCDERELKRETPSYTVETLLEYRKEYQNETLFFIIGMDSLLSFTTWHRYKDILSLCHIVVNTRPGYAKKNMTAEIQALLQHHQVNNLSELAHYPVGKIIFAPTSDYNISSTQIRKQLANLSNEQQLLSPAVLTYINKHKLYSR